MNLVGQDDLAVCVDAELVLGVHQDQAAGRRHLLPAGEQRQGVLAQRLPLQGAQQTLLDDFGRRQGRVVVAVIGLGGRRDDGGRQFLVVGKAIGQPVAVHLPLALLVERQDRGAGGPGQVAAHHDLHRQDVQPGAHHHIGVGIGEHVVGADVGGGVEPEPRRLGQDLPLVGDHRQDGIEGRQPVAGDDHDPSVPQVVGVAHLAPVVIGQLGKLGVGQDLVGAGGQRRCHCLAMLRRQSAVQFV